MTSVNKTIKVAAIQMVSGASLDANLARAGALIAEAAEKGARVIALPDYFCFMGHRDRDKLAIRETPGAGKIQEFLADTARRHRIWRIGGPLPLQTADPDRLYHPSLVFGPAGESVGTPDNIPP